VQGLKLVKGDVEPPVEHFPSGAGLHVGDDQEIAIQRSIDKDIM
jgi:hypothetical protein